MTAGQNMSGAEDSHRAARQGSTRWLALSAACFSMAWLVKINGLMFLPAIAWMWMVTPEENSARAAGILPLRFDRIKSALRCVPVFLPFWLAEVGFDYWRFGHWPVAVWERDTSFTGWGFHNLPAGPWGVTLGPVREPVAAAGHHASVPRPQPCCRV